MPTDNQPAKSYIATVLARADAATPGGSDGGWLARYGGGSPDPTRHYATKVQHMEIRRDGDNYGDDIIAANGTYVLMSENDAKFIAASRQDSPTLGKMLLRAIKTLEGVAISQCDCESDGRMIRAAAAKALAAINALAAKGSQ